MGRSHRFNPIFFDKYRFNPIDTKMNEKIEKVKGYGCRVSNIKHILFCLLISNINLNYN